MKKGIRTTEFWITILTVIGSVAASMEGVLDPKYAAMAASVSTIAYTLSRGFVKLFGEAK